MDSRAEIDAVALIATALLLLNAPEGLQVMWLIGLVGVLVALAVHRADDSELGGGDGGGGGGLRRPRPIPMPPTGVM